MYSTPMDSTFSSDRAVPGYVASSGGTLVTMELTTGGGLGDFVAPSTVGDAGGISELVCTGAVAHAGTDIRRAALSSAGRSVRQRNPGSTRTLLSPLILQILRPSPQPRARRSSGGSWVAVSIAVPSKYDARVRGWALDLVPEVPRSVSAALVREHIEGLKPHGIRPNGGIDSVN